MDYLDSVRVDPGVPSVGVKPKEKRAGEGETMFRLGTQTDKWISIPVLLIASLFACCAASYEPLVDLAICLGAMVFVQRAIRVREYFWAAGFLAIVVVFLPLSLAVKIFLLMGFTCVATFAALLTAFRTQPAPAA